MPPIDWDQIAPHRPMTPYETITGQDRLPKARVDQLEECTQRYLGKLVRSNAEYTTKLGIVEQVATQYEAWGRGDRDLLVLVIRTAEGRKKSSWIIHDLIEVWGEVSG